MKKKICILVEHDFLPPHGRTYDEMRFLSEDGFEITLLSISKRLLPRVENLEYGVIKRIYRIGMLYPRIPFFHNPFLMVKTLLLAVKENADLYYIYDMGNIIVAILLKILGQKVIYDIGDDGPSNQAGYASRRLHSAKIAFPLEFFLRILEANSLKLFDMTVTLTNSLKNDRIEYNRKIETLYYSPPPEYNTDNVNPELIKKYGNTNFLVYEGAVTLSKGYDIIHSIAHKLCERKKDTKILIIGDAKSFAPNIIVTGYKHYLEVPQYINLGKVGLALLKPWNYSYRISVPNKVIDYMACGKPVIASKEFVEVERIIKKSKGGIVVDSYDLNDIFSAIEWLLDDEELRLEMGIKARAYIEKYHNWHNFKENFIHIVRDVMDNQTPRKHVGK